MRARRYRVQIEGELDERYATVFSPLSVEVGDGSTVLVGVIRDQAELQGVVMKVSGLGLSLVRLETVDDLDDLDGHPI